MKLVTVCSNGLVKPLMEIKDIKVTEVFYTGHFWQKNGIMDGGINFHMEARYRNRDTDKLAWLVEYPRALTDVVRNTLQRAQAIIEIEATDLLQNTAAKKLVNLQHTGVLLDDYCPYYEVPGEDVGYSHRNWLSAWVAQLCARFSAVLG